MVRLLVGANGVAGAYPGGAGVFPDPAAGGDGAGGDAGGGVVAMAASFGSSHGAMIFCTAAGV